MEIISSELSKQQEHCSTQTKQLLAENAKLKRKLNGEPGGRKEAEMALISSET